MTETKTRIKNKRKTKAVIEKQNPKRNSYAINGVKAVESAASKKPIASSRVVF